MNIIPCTFRSKIITHTRNKRKINKYLNKEF